MIASCESQWSYGVTVSTLDSESSDRGSNPRRTFHAHGWLLIYNDFLILIGTHRRSDKESLADLSALLRLVCRLAAAMPQHRCLITDMFVTSK